jgi:hypothetical protein
MSAEPVEQPRTSTRKRKPSAALLEAAGEVSAAQRIRLTAKSEEAIEEVPEESIRYDQNGDISVGGGSERSPSVTTSTTTNGVYPGGGHGNGYNGAAPAGDLPVNGFSPPKPREAVYQ